MARTSWHACAFYVQKVVGCAIPRLEALVSRHTSCLLPSFSSLSQIPMHFSIQHSPLLAFSIFIALLCIFTGAFSDSQLPAPARLKFYEIYFSEMTRFDFQPCPPSGPRASQVDCAPWEKKDAKRETMNGVVWCGVTKVGEMGGTEREDHARAAENAQ